jgi:hypothetical protein
MPTPPKPRRTQARYNPQRETQRDPEPETIELVDPTWLLKAIGLTLLIALLCTLATTAYFHHYQKAHSKPEPATQSTQPRPASTLNR